MTAQAVPATVEELVRGRLTKALGGGRGIVEGAAPTLGFTVTYLLTHQWRTALLVGALLAVVLLVVRIVQRQPVQFVVNSLVGIGIAAVFAARSGRASDVFLPGIIYNTGYFVLMVGSVLARWPVVGLLIASVTGDLTAWRSDSAVLKLCSRLTLVLALPCMVRVLVQLPLYLADRTVWLGVTKLALGWPLQVAALAGIAWMLARGRTPLAMVPATPAEPDGDQQADLD